ncbi:Clavaminate synthase-like protein [Cantharellus anzutake]|uniref:Clavaminate synthase-like protein n=1 Tax=Cantharellus anzutake TaxID=1750568 RepID=UPI001903A02C|nr:Clavaminate synthase-like protein [Cantharellus anzutake]KAF8334988.1 Clavaminate synthase-like protein [Cantharellus anzutake]
MAALAGIAEPVTISYNDLINAKDTLVDPISRAFGSNEDALGIIVVNQLPPEYPSLRGRLLKLAHKFGSLDELVRSKYSDPLSNYSFGWSWGKEIMNGAPDTLKGSYYANISIPGPESAINEDLRKSYREYYGDNIWPSQEPGLEALEEAFVSLGRFILDIGCDLATACQPFVSSQLRDNSVTLSEMIKTSPITKARLLHYFPPPNTSTTPDDEPVDSWCGFHKDHSLITGLCSAMYLSRPSDCPAQPIIVPSPSPSSGLYIKTRGGDLRRVAIPADALAFQIGEALELATDGNLRATPHCVRVGGGSNAISRETFALFMQPDVRRQISTKETFGEFSKRVFAEHYQGIM